MSRQRVWKIPRSWSRVLEVHRQSSRGGYYPSLHEMAKRIPCSDARMSRLLRAMCERGVLREVRRLWLTPTWEPLPLASTLNRAPRRVWRSRPMVIS